MALDDYGPRVMALEVRVDQHDRRLDEHLVSINRIDERTDRIEIRWARLIGVLIGSSVGGSAIGATIVTAIAKAIAG